MSPAALNALTVRPRILVVEDEPSISDAIQFPLESDGCDTECCATGAEALRQVASGRFDLVVLDVGLPDVTGFEVCRRIRESSQVPIVFLTARAEEIDRVVGLEIGGDDYLMKPFSPRELSARVRAVLRRTQNGHASAVAKADSAVAANAPGRTSDPVPIEIDEERKAIAYFGLPLDLSRYEYRLLVFLAGRPGLVFSRAQLMDAAWEEPEASMERTVDAHVKSLRAKLRAARPGVEAIRTHRGFGYSLADDL
jgi:two-component system, OmpR family, catabolic regulation response regulator CreB